MLAIVGIIAIFALIHQRLSQEFLDSNKELTTLLTSDFFGFFASLTTFLGLLNVAPRTINEVSSALYIQPPEVSGDVHSSFFTPTELHTVEQEETDTYIKAEPPLSAGPSLAQTISQYGLKFAQPETETTKATDISKSQEE